MWVQCPQKPEGTGCPSIRVTDGFKFPCGCGEEDQVLWKCSYCSQPLSHHSSPKLIPLKKHFQVPKIKTAKVSGLWGALRQMLAEAGVLLKVTMLNAYSAACGTVEAETPLREERSSENSDQWMSPRLS